jgi:hypothetical protein
MKKDPFVGMAEWLQSGLAIPLADYADPSNLEVTASLARDLDRNLGLLVTDLDTLFKRAGRLYVEAMIERLQILRTAIRGWADHQDWGANH